MFSAFSSLKQVNSERLCSKVAELTSKKGPELLTRMLRHHGHLTSGRVTTLRERKLTDGVKGDKAILEVTYSEAAWTFLYLLRRAL